MAEERPGADTSEESPQFTVEFCDVDPRSPDAVWAVTKYFAELGRRFREGFEPGDAVLDDAADHDPPHGVFVVAYIDELPVACGGVRRLDGGIAEIKKMWVMEQARGRGLGSRMLVALEARAAALGHHTVRLDTNSQLPEAVRMYRSAGYAEIERYNDNPHPDHFFEKVLAP